MQINPKWLQGGFEICDVVIKFRDLGIEEFRDFSRPGSIPLSLNSQFLNV
jgi:hypothetical protein